MELEIRLRVDGRQHRLVVDTRTTLADERQPVPLRRPRQHRPGDRGGGGPMGPFAHQRPHDVAGAVTMLTEAPNGTFLAGGTNLLDLVEEGR